MGKKRWYHHSQISIFVVFGLMFLMLVFFFYLYNVQFHKDIVLRHKQNVDVQQDRDALENYVEYCILNDSKKILMQLGLNGGTLNKSNLEMNSKLYHGNKYRMLCVQVEGSRRCINRVLTLKEMEMEISNEILKEIDSCIDFEYFRQIGYDIKKGEKSLAVSIGLNQISYELNYPIHLVKEGIDITAERFYTRQVHPFGMVYKLVLDILNHEAIDGSFDKDRWMNENSMLFSIKKNKPYPFVTYLIESRDEADFAFAFSVEHEDKASRAGRNYLYDLEYGCCYVENQCFKNVDEYTCRLKNGSYVFSSGCSCNYNYIGEGLERGLDDCIGRKDGESWCEFIDGIGGRSIKHSCHDSELFLEECKDFKEEVCVEFVEEGLTKAVCKPNRYDDCTKCDTQECCENDIMRDCMWIKGEYDAVFEWGVKSCIPKLAPGFRFWDGYGQEACNLGTRYAICDGYNCDQEWVRIAAESCSNMGDCGMNVNCIGKLTTSGYFETDPKYNPKFSDKENPFFTLNTAQNKLAYGEERETIILIPALVSAGMRFMDDVSNKRGRILDYSFCGLWQPPINSQDCGICNDGICSEYRCRSLDQNCVYTEENGFSKCEKKLVSGTIPIIDFVTDVKYEAGKMEIAGRQINGFEIIDKLPPYQQLIFKIETSIPTKCKITYMPELSFTETPAIWFGEPKFETVHNVTFRLPDKIFIPDKLYNNLDVKSLSEFFDLIVDNDDKLEKYFGRVFMTIAEKMSDKLSTREYLRQLLKLTVSGIDNNTYHTFIRCSDEAGNENKEPMYLKFTIDDAYIDTQPPKLLLEFPKNNSQLNTEEYNLSIFLDEPAECRYSYIDKPYMVMENKFDCETSRMRMSSVASGSYECKANPGEKSLYVRCKDNPPEIKRYSFDIREGINQTKVMYEIDDQAIYLREHELENKIIVYLEDVSKVYRINMDIDPGYECKIGFRGFDEDMVELECNHSDGLLGELSDQSGELSDQPGELSDQPDDQLDYACAMDFVPYNHTAFIFCHGEIPETRNVNEIGYLLNYTLNKELSIVSFFPEYDDVVDSGVVELGIVVNRNINDESVNCGYSFDNDFYQMHQYGTYQFKRKFYGLEPGRYDVRFRCKDNSGSIAEAMTSFVTD